MGWLMTEGVMECIMRAVKPYFNSKSGKTRKPGNHWFLKEKNAPQEKIGMWNYMVLRTPTGFSRDRNMRNTDFTSSLQGGFPFSRGVQPPAECSKGRPVPPERLSVHILKIDIDPIGRDFKFSLNEIAQLL